MNVNYFIAPVGRWDKRYLDEIKNAIITNGDNFYYCPYENNKYLVDYTNVKDGPTVFYGPIQFVRKMLKETQYYPGAFSFKEYLHCNEYMSYYPLDMFLNGDGYFTTFGMLKQCGITEEIFIRPNSPYKTFTGFTIKPEDFNIEMNTLKTLNNINNEELILLSKPKKILAEFRSIICDSKIVAHSQYQWEGRMDRRTDILPECYELTDQFIKHFSIDDVYVVDSCMTENGPKIVEINSFSSSGLYEADKIAIFKNVSKIAIRQYSDLM